MNAIPLALHNSWDTYISTEFEKPYFIDLTNFLAEEIEQGKTIYPKPADIFAAFHATDFHDVQVVILGQDPYHGAHQAHGLSFSVPEGEKIPPSLRNIYKELENEYSDFSREHGNLISWAHQGVLLLNATLTVEAEKAGSHQKKGWEIFTDTVIQTLSEKREGIIFVLWGAYAQKKSVLIDPKKHHILEAPHPSPLSAHRGFFGCGHFQEINTLLQQHNKKSIDWEK